MPDSGRIVAKRLWVGHAVAAANESRAIRFVRRFSDGPSMHRHEVHQARYGFAVRARTARAQDRLSRADDLGLYEQIGERRVERVRGSRGEDHFRVADDVDGPRPACEVGDAHSSQLDVVFGRDDDLGVGFEILVTAAKLDA